MTVTGAPEAPPPPGPPPPPDPSALPGWLERLGRRHPLVIAALIVTVVVTSATTAVTLAGFLATRWWVFDILTSFRPQAIVVLALCALCLLALRCWPVLAVALVALALNLGQVAPVYTRHQLAAANGSPTLTVAHLNLQSRQADVPALRSWLDGHPADVVVVLDTTRNLADAVRDGAGDYRMVYPAVIGPTPSRPNRPDRRSGTSERYEPASAEVVVLTDRPDVTATTPTSAGLPDSSVELQATLGATPVELLGLHTESPTTPARAASRDRQLGAVGDWLDGAPRPAVAFGDFNVTYFSPTFRRLLDRSGATTSQLGFGIQPTWPAGDPPAAIAIDQSVFTGGLTATSRVRGPSLGSEHRSLIVTYALAQRSS